MVCSASLQPWHSTSPEIKHAFLSHQPIKPTSLLPSPRRSHQYYVALFEKAGLRMTHTAVQKDFPKGLFKGEAGPLTQRQVQFASACSPACRLYLAWLAACNQRNLAFPCLGVTNPYPHPTFY